ncbi:MAG TPA: F0F1 ATP synthase subunit A [Usitatibacter sp.]|nr:F0F1 ATP synthase subunit A [Usitatibacter sp.]
MAAEQTTLTPAEYMTHHLTFLNRGVADHGGFWSLNVDTLIVSIILGFAGLGFFYWIARGTTTGVPNKRQAFVEFFFDFVDREVKDIFHHGDRHRFVGPVALTVAVWVVLMNAMDFLPADFVTWITSHLGLGHFRPVPTADVNTTFALALSVWLLMILFSVRVKGFGGFVHELFCSPFGSNPVLWPVNFAFNAVEYLSKPLSHSLRLFGNMYAGEIIYLLLWMLASAGITFGAAAVLLGIGWSIFHVLIVLLQAYIFMMLTIVYIAMAHESH